MLYSFYFSNLASYNFYLFQPHQEQELCILTKAFLGDQLSPPSKLIPCGQVLANCYLETFTANDLVPKNTVLNTD